MYAVRPVFKEHAKQGKTLVVVFDAVCLAATLAECKIPFVVEETETGQVVGGKRWLARWALEEAPGPRNNRRRANVN